MCTWIYGQFFANTLAVTYDQRKEKTMPPGVNLMRSQVLHQAAQVYMTIPTDLSMLSSSQIQFGHSPHAKCPAELLCSWWSKGIPLQSLTCPKAVQCLGRLPGRLRPGACHMWHLTQGTQKPLSLGPSARSPERCNSHMSLVPQQQPAQTGDMTCMYTC